MDEATLATEIVDELRYRYDPATVQQLAPEELAYEVLLVEREITAPPEQPPGDGREWRSRTWETGGETAPGAPATEVPAGPREAWERRDWPTEEEESTGDLSPHYR